MSHTDTFNDKMHEIDISLVKLNNDLHTTTQSTIKLTSVVEDLFDRHIKLSQEVSTTKAKILTTMASVFALSSGFVYIFQDKMAQINNTASEVHELRTTIEVIKQDLHDAKISKNDKKFNPKEENIT